MSERPMHAPGNFELLTRLYAEGEQLLAAGRLDEAVARFSEALERKPDPYTEYLAAGCCAALGHADAMLAHAARALQGSAEHRAWLAQDEEFVRYRDWPPFAQLLASA